MVYNTILVKESMGVVTITFNRIAQKNSINAQFLIEVNDVLDKVENNSDCKVVILEGQNGVFCTGMDFGAVAADENKNGEKVEEVFTPMYMKTIKRLSLMPKVVISKVDGQVMAGGVGIVAASDLVIASPRSQFSLSEVLWGLLPAMVTPYLIRRIGFQKAYSMTLTTIPVSAQEGKSINLVDEVSESLDDSIRRLCQRFSRLETSTIGNLKNYFRSMWIITENMEETAVSEITRLMSQESVKENISNFVLFKKFPWEKK